MSIYLTNINQSIYRVPGTALVTGERTVKKKTKVPVLTERLFTPVRAHMHVFTCVCLTAGRIQRVKTDKTQNK